MPSKIQKASNWHHEIGCSYNPPYLIDLLSLLNIMVLSYLSSQKKAINKNLHPVITSPPPLLKGRG